MADDVTITGGANSTPLDGTIIATDDIGGVHYQRMKLVMGADGAADMDLDSGQQTKANSLPVTLASDEDALAVTVAALPLPAGAATSANQTTMITSLQLIDDLRNALDSVGTDELDVNVEASVLPTGAAIAASQQPPATTPNIYNVTMILVNTEYSQLLPANTKRFSLQCLTENDIRFAFVPGRVAVPVPPYAMVRGGMNYYEDSMNLAATTLYVACAAAGRVAEIIAWT